MARLRNLLPCTTNDGGSIVSAPRDKLMIFQVQNMLTIQLTDKPNNRKEKKREHEQINFKQRKKSTIVNMALIRNQMYRKNIKKFELEFDDDYDVLGCADVMLE